MDAGLEQPRAASGSAPPSDDPWAPLDPHETVGGPALAPFKRLTTYRKPAGLSKGKKGSKRTAKTAVESITSFCASSCTPCLAPATRHLPLLLSASRTWCTSVHLPSCGDFARRNPWRQAYPCALLACSPVRQDSTSRRLPTNAAKRPEYPEFATMYWAEQKRRSSAQKADRVAIAALKQHVYTLQQASDNGNLSLAVLDEEDGFEGFGGPDDFEEMAADEFVPQENDAADPMLAGLAQEGPTSSYEDLVRDHIARYVRQAEKYVQETELSRRVAAWESRIGPILAQEEEHDPFDIHAYGATILDKMPSKGKSE